MMAKFINYICSSSNQRNDDAWFYHGSIYLQGDKTKIYVIEMIHYFKKVLNQKNAENNLEKWFVDII